MKKALFLDRDGIINVDHGYVYKIEDFEFMPNIFNVCKKASDKGYELIVITNQSGIARGKYSIAEFEKLTQWMKDKFTEKGIIIRDVYFCPHHPTKGINEYADLCKCRKPEPGMIIKAAKEHKINLLESIFIGDKVSDIQAAQAAGIPTRILITNHCGVGTDIEAHRLTEISEICTFFT